MPPGAHVYLLRANPVLLMLWIARRFETMTASVPTADSECPIRSGPYQQRCPLSCLMEFFDSFRDEMLPLVRCSKLTEGSRSLPKTTCLDEVSRPRVSRAFLGWCWCLFITGFPLGSVVAPRVSLSSECSDGCGCNFFYSGYFYFGSGFST